jgi:hypothetical protein
MVCAASASYRPRPSSISSMLCWIAGRAAAAARRMARLTCWRRCSYRSNAWARLMPRPV